MNGVHPKAIGMDWIFCTKEKSTDSILDQCLIRKTQFLRREAVFGLYLKNLADDSYILLEEFATINDALESCCIEGKPFKEIIVDGDTELVGQD